MNESSRVEREIARTTDAPTVVRETALEFAEMSHELSREMADHLHAEIPELDARDADLLRHTQASCQSNLSQSYRLLHEGRRAADFGFTPDMHAYVLAFVERDLALPVLLRTYRLGHAWIWQQWSDQLKKNIADQTELAAAIEFSSLWMFEYIDLASAALVDDFAREQALRLRSVDQLVAATVRELLAGDPIDLDTASRRIGYDLRRRHLAMRVTATEAAQNALESAVGTVAELLGASEPLRVRSGALAVTAWCGFDGSAREVANALGDLQPPEGITIAIGLGHGPGVDGFRVARDEAVEAERIAAECSLDPGHVTLYSQVELVSLLSADGARAKRFVEERLGELAALDEGTSRLRETLLVYLQLRGSSSRAAKSLFVHQNTVTYRIHRAEELLGRSIGDDQGELLCALLLAVRLGYGSSLPSQPS